MSTKKTQKLHLEIQGKLLWSNPFIIQRRWKSKAYKSWTTNRDEHEWRLEDGWLRWRFKEELIEAEELLDGYYIIRSDVSAKEMGSLEIVASYKRLTLVEQAFRSLKSVRLEVRPVYHKTDERIMCHVFILSSLKVRHIALLIY